MKTNLILKKTLKSFFEEQRSENEIYEIKKKHILESINENDRISLILDFANYTGNYTTSPAQHYLLTNRDAEGVTKMEQGLYWYYHYIMNVDMGNIVFNACNIGFVIGLAYLFNHRTILEESISRFEKYMSVNRKEKSDESNSHVFFLYFLTNKVERLPESFTGESSVYTRLLENINKPNDEIIEIIEEACEYHLNHCPANNKTSVQFLHCPLLPYEIQSYLIIRGNLGFQEMEVNIN